MNTIINVECVDQDLMITNAPTLASGGICENVVSFKFCNKWDDFNKTAVFYQNEKNVYYALINSQNECEIPHEVTLNEGTLYIGVFGVKGDTRRTSKVDKIRIHKGAWTKDMHPSDPTPDIYTQLLSELKEVDDLLKGFLDGTYKTPVGNAKTLEGHGPDYFATAESVANIQTTSRATLEQVGWYRVAEYNGNPDTLRGAGGNSCRIWIKREYAFAQNEFHELVLDSTWDKQEFSAIRSMSKFQLITKMRYTRDSAKAYIEIYYSDNISNSVQIGVNDGKDYVSMWQAITPILTSETVDGVTVTTTYDIPANASPVTDLDINKLVDGTTPAGDASKLGGKGASEYALKTTVNGVEIGNGGSVTVYSPSELEPNSAFLSVEGWYRVLQFDGFGTYELDFMGTYAYGKPVIAKLLIAIGYNTADIVQLSNMDGWAVSKVRVVHRDGTGFVEVYYNVNASNSVDVRFNTPIKSVTSNVSFTPGSIPDGYTATEFELSSNPIKASAFEGNLVGTASGNLPLSGGRIDGVGGTTFFVNNKNGDDVWVGYQGEGADLGFIGFVGADKLKFLKSDRSANYDILHTGNMAEYVLPKSGGGEVKAMTREVITVNRTDNALVSIAFKANNSLVGQLGFDGVDNPTFWDTADKKRQLLHTGNSAKLLISDTPLTEDGVIRVW